MSERIFLITDKVLLILNEAAISRKIEYNEIKGISVLVKEG
jgi:hypothetical protein